MWILLIIAYLCGSIPFGLMIVRAVAGIDLRTVGSGNIGATNTSRAVGKTWAAVVLLLDALKGALPTALGPLLAKSLGVAMEDQTVQVLSGLAAILGHMFPVWLRFRGGKGVATALGVACVLSPIGTAVAAAVFFGVFAAGRIVSVSSLAAAVTFALYQMWSLQPDPFKGSTQAMAAFSLAVPALIVVRHASNIARLLSGKESALQRQKTPPREEQDSTPTANRQS